jgi:hypothetical protein
MNIVVPIQAGSRAILSFVQAERRFRLNLIVQGQRPRMNGTEPDLIFHFLGGGLLTLRPLSPITGSPGIANEWTSSYGLERRQLMLLAIYPTVRMRLEPWTGCEGLSLIETGIDQALMAAACNGLGIDFVKSRS